jgi:hypothetical protein
MSFRCLPSTGPRLNAQCLSMAQPALTAVYRIRRFTSVSEKQATYVHMKHWSEQVVKDVCMVGGHPVPQQEDRRLSILGQQETADTKE